MELELFYNKRLKLKTEKNWKHEIESIFQEAFPSFRACQEGGECRCGFQKNSKIYIFTSRILLKFVEHFFLFPVEEELNNINIQEMKCLSKRMILTEQWAHGKWRKVCVSKKI